MNTETNIKKYSPAYQEVNGIIKEWRIWLILSWNDIKLRYRRSSLGPFWITLSMAIRIYFMGFLYGHLFKVDINTYFPYLASGIITWVTISSVVSESTISFIQAQSYLRNINIHYSHLSMQVVLRNVIIFAHNILAYIPVIAYFGRFNSDFSALNTLLLFPGLLLLTIAAFFWGSILAILGTRFRDMPLITDSMIQVVFFVTPIMWMPSLLPEKYIWLAMLNPFYHLVALIREPMLGHSINLLSIEISLAITVIGMLFYSYLINRTKYKIIFWL